MEAVSFRRNLMECQMLLGFFFQRLRHLAQHKTWAQSQTRVEKVEKSFQLIYGVFAEGALALPGLNG